MSASRARASSIPRGIIARNRVYYSVEDAHELLGNLEALDQLLSSTPASQHKNIHFDSIVKSDKEEKQSPVDVPVIDVKIQGILNFVSDTRIRGPNGIPAAFVRAYQTVLTGRTYINEPSVRDFLEGRECTCSEAVQALPQLDAILETSLGAHFDAANAKIKPLPLLLFPAELRLQIYGYLLPRAPYLSLCGHPLPLYRSPPAQLAIMRASRQLHAEVSKYFYDRRLLFLKMQKGNADEIMQSRAFYESHVTLARVPQQTRHLFQALEVQIDTRTDRRRREEEQDHIDPDDAIQTMLTLLPRLSSVLITFNADENIRWPRVPSGTLRGYHKMAAWLYEKFHHQATVRWDFSGLDDAAIKTILRHLEGKVPIEHGESVSRVCQAELDRKKFIKSQFRVVIGPSRRSVD